MSAQPDTLDTTQLHAPRPLSVDPVRAAIGRLGHSFCEENLIVPESLVDGRLTVRHPDDSPEALRKIRRHAGLRDVVINKGDAAILVGDLTKLIGPQPKTDSSRIQRLISDTFIRGANLNASDVLFEPELDRVHLRYDCEGLYRHEATFTLDDYARILSILGPATFTALDKEVGQKGRYTVNADGRELHLRGASWPRWLINQTQPKLDYRILLPYYLMRTYDQLNMKTAEKNTLLTALKAAKAGIIVAGPPGHGKTSTLFAALQNLKPQGRNIYAIEDPPEIYVPWIWTTELTPNWTHADAIALTNRLNADFVFVGETLDERSAILTLNATLASVPCATTVHAVDIVEAIDRILSMNVERDRVERGVTCLLAQRLLNPVCPTCCKTIPTPDTIREIFDSLGVSAPTHVRQRVNTLGQDDHECPDCFGHGAIAPRLAIFETGVTSAKLRDAIRNRASADEIAKILYNANHLPMITSGIELLTQGIIDVDAFLQIPIPFGDAKSWL